MPSYKDKATGKWFCKFYYIDPQTGKKRQRKKRGFELKREAEAFEREFLAELSYSPSMSFAEFYERYRADKDPQLQEHTILTRGYQMKKIMPVFGHKPLDSITGLEVSQWHNELIGEGLSQTYINNLHTCLSSIFNHAVRFYGLRINPCKQAGRAKLRESKKRDMRFWTLEQFQDVDSALAEVRRFIKPRTLLNLMYWSGMRKGELLALTWGDIDLTSGTVSITKSYQRLKGKPVITSTKTGISRKVILPPQVIKLLEVYKSIAYDSSDLMAVFPYERKLIEDVIQLASELSGVPRIHVHGLRHSHASLLIQLDVNIVLISKRLGHEKVSTTLDTYSHFFPDDELKAVDKMSKAIGGTETELESDIDS